MLTKLAILSFVVSATLAGVVPLEKEVDTPPPPPRPYAFGYAAGRYPGHIDRTHSEVSDGAGNVQGSYSYVDPSFKIRKVDYVVDRDGFHPVLNQNPPALPNDTPVVAAAKEKHLIQYARIADSLMHPPQATVPRDTEAVEYAKNQHFALYQQIAEEHARIGAERAAEEARIAAEEARVAAEEAQYPQKHPNSLDY